MTAHVALVRGINVGGHRRVPMAHLRTLFTDAGATDVSTYIQSGNVVFRASSRAVAGIATAVRRALEAEHGGAIPIVTRTAAEWRAIRTGVPFDDPADDRASLHVGLLGTAPTRAVAAALDPRRSPGDRFEVIDGTIYLDLPNGIRGSTLTVAWFERALDTSCTVRNWRTVEALGTRLDALE